MKKPVLAVLAVLVLVLAGVAGYFLVIDEDTEEEVSLGDAPLVDASSTTAPDDAAMPAGAESADGDWTVVADPAVFAGYRITKSIVGIDSEVTGRTPDVTGTLTVDGDTVTTAAFEVDMTTITSGDSRRDNKMLSEGFEAASFPTATLAIDQPLELGTTPAKGEEIATAAEASLTLHGVTKPVTVTVSARWNGDTLDLTASAPVLLSDFGMVPPGVPGATVADNGVLEAQLAFSR